METPATRPNRSAAIYLLLGAGIVGVLAVCAVLLIGFLFRDQLCLILGLCKAQSAAIVPANAPVYAAFNLDLTQAKGAQRISDIYTKAIPSGSAPADWRADFQEQTGLDFDQDVLSWIGPEVGVVVTDLNALGQFSGSSGAGNPTSAAVLLGTRDVSKSTTALAKAFANLKEKGSTASELTYNNVRLTKLENSQGVAGGSGYVGTINNFVILATTEEAAHAVIDAATNGGDKTLANSPQFKEAMARLPSARVGTLYLSDQVFGQFQTLPRGLSSQTFMNMSNAANGLAASLGFTDQGLQIDYVVSFAADKLGASQKAMFTKAANSNQALNAAPQNALLYYSGSDLKQYWNASLESLPAPTQTEFQQSLRQIETQLGINLEQDILSWLDGEFAFALVPAAPISSNAPGVGGLVFVEAKDQTLIQDKLSRVQSSLARNGLVFAPQTIGGVPMQVMSPGGSAGPSFGFGFIDKFLVLGGPRDALASAVDAPKNSLVNSPLLKEVRANLPQVNTGIAYVNLDGLLDVLEPLVLSTAGAQAQEYQSTGRPLLRPVKAIGMASEAGTPNLTHTIVFVYIDQP